MEGGMNKRGGGTDWMMGMGMDKVKGGKYMADFVVCFWIFVARCV